MVDTALGRLEVQARGSGEAMMFWPSLLMTGDMWAAQADHFADRCRVILVDPPGHGRSEKLTGMFTFDDCAVLMNCTASPAGARQKLEYGFLLRLARLLGGIRPPLTRSVLKAFLGPTTFSGRPDVVTFVRDTVEAVDIGSASWAVKSVVPARPDQRSLFAKISTPVLVVAGAEDATFPVPETLEMAKAIPRAATAVLDGVAHLAGLEDPALVNTLIEEFVVRG